MGLFRGVGRTDLSGWDFRLVTAHLYLFSRLTGYVEKPHASRGCVVGACRRTQPSMVTIVVIDGEYGRPDIPRRSLWNNRTNSTIIWPRRSRFLVLDCRHDDSSNEASTMHQGTDKGLSRFHFRTSSTPTSNFRCDLIQCVHSQHLSQT